MTPRVTIDEFFRANRETLSLELIDGRRGLSRSVEIPRIQKPGLAFAGYLPQIHPDRIQVVGNTELGYLRTLQPAEARHAVERVCQQRIACLVITNGAEPPSPLVEVAAARGVPLLATPLST